VLCHNKTISIAYALAQEGDLISAQIRAARGLLGWTARGLAEKIGVHRNTVSNIEVGRYAPPDTMAAIRRAFEKAGVEFTNGKRPGVRLRKKR
jgi:DNA-binding XRE family transcriptional regulator